jgi:membrane dipeptidase
LFLALAFALCGFAGNLPQQTNNSAPKPNDAELRARAERLHREAIVIDTHNDITSHIIDFGFDLGMAGDSPGGVAFDYTGTQPIPKNGKYKTETDLRRLKAGGVDGEFFVAYVAAKYAKEGGAARRALDMIDVIYEQVRRHPDALEMASTADDIRRISKKGKIAALIGIEGGHAIEDSLPALRMFYKLGVRYMTLTHTNTNNWADSSGDINNAEIKHHDGLTDFGREVVREMNRLGMMIDISHVADKTFYDAVEVSRAPVIASHSSARALADHPRNMTDDMLRAIARNGGVVMVNFYDGFIDSRKVEFNKRARARQEELNKQFPSDASRVEEEMKKWRAANDPGRTPLSKLIDHFDHVAKVAGIDHVGIGSDFDGDITPPEGMEDISRIPAITYELMKRGYSDADIKKILGENFLRVMAAVERTAAQMQSSKAAAPAAKN